MTPKAGCPLITEQLHFNAKKKSLLSTQSKTLNASENVLRQEQAESESTHLKEMNANLESQTDRIIGADLSGADEGLVERRDHSENLRSTGIEDFTVPGIDIDQEPDDIDFDEGVRERPGSSHNESIE